MFETKSRTNLVFVNQSGHKIIGDHKRVPIRQHRYRHAGVVAALLGALSTPQAIRHEEPAPTRLNKQREKKGKVPVAPVIVIDVRASHLAKSPGRGRPPWRTATSSPSLPGVNVEGDIPPLNPERGERCNDYIILAIFCHNAYLGRMSTMNISLPDNLKTFVDQQVSERGYGTSSEYVRELIRRDRDREQLRGLLMEGASTPPTEPIDDRYFENLRDRIQSRTKA
ncbi:ribbon-helix-helix domain-containing protein [Mesorhizobium shangrilense]|uniref:ribbon-helix-helix domain-containing protein n=1 Tax=Mesorhizobium shangrilense TaxID=460060 RepID=UPI003F49311E